MFIFDQIEELFQSFRELNEYTRALVTLITLIGILLIAVIALRYAWVSIQGFRLYVLSQCCFKGDLVKKYGRWACISGSTDGIGLAFAEELAKRGHSIIVIGRNEEKLARVKESLEQLLKDGQGEIVTVRIDLSDSSIENYERIRNQIGFDTRDIGILINNAGCFPPELKRFGKFDMADIRDIVNVNILATLYLTRMAIPGMNNRGKGLILNVSSIMSYHTAVYCNVYAPTKAFINRFSEQIQHEYRSHPIDIINLTPGAVHTKLFTSMNKITKPGIINPTAEHYARWTLNAVSTGIRCISGTIVHGISLRVIEIMNLLDITPYAVEFWVKRMSNNITLSPVMKRRNVNTQPNEESVELNRA